MAVILQIFMKTTQNRHTTLPKIPGELDTEECGFINANHHGGYVLQCYWQVQEIFSLPSQSVQILSWDCRIIPESNSPMTVLPTMQSDDIRQENMATVNIA